MSRRELCVKLAHGFRLDVVTVTDRDADTVTCTAQGFHGSDLIAEHVATASGSEFDTIGDLMRWRGEWLEGLVRLTEGRVEYLIAERVANHLQIDYPQGSDIDTRYC